MPLAAPIVALAAKVMLPCHVLSPATLRKDPPPPTTPCPLMVRASLPTVNPLLVATRRSCAPEATMVPSAVLPKALP